MLDILLSIPKTLYFNFRFLSFRQALKLPVWIHFRCKLAVHGKVICRSSAFASVRLGFHTVYNVEENRTCLIVQKEGRVEFNGSAHVGRGSKLIVYEGASLVLGSNFTISASSAIKCHQSVCIGDNVLMGWNNLILDSDAHEIYDAEGCVTNSVRPVYIGNKVWIGCNVIILKGTDIPDNCVVGAGAVLSGNSFSGSTVIAGNPAKSIKSIGGWVE